MEVIDEKKLLARRNATAPIGPLDGLVGAPFYDGAYFITSGNQKCIYRPPITNKRPLRLCSDSLYGEDDPIRWPQPYNNMFPHYSSIPRFTSSCTHPEMWWEPSKAFFEPQADTGVILGLGKLAASKYMALENATSALLVRVEEYSAKAYRVPSLLGPMVQMMKHSLEQLRSISMNFRQVSFQVRAIQRSWLEVTAMLDYMEIYKPRMDGHSKNIGSNKSPSVAETIGIFTYDVRVAQDHFQAGLPYWLVRPASAINDTNILRVSEPLHPENYLQLDPHPFKYPVLAEGPAGTDAKFNAIYAYARNFLKYPDPFNGPTTIFPSSTIQPQLSFSASGSIRSVAPFHSEFNENTSRAGPSRTASKKTQPASHHNTLQQTKSQRNNQRFAYGGRNKYEAIDSPIMPISIASWQNALKAVNTDPSNLENLTRVNEHDGKYLFPEPGLFAGVTNEVRRARYFATWNAARTACIYRVYSGSLDVVPLSSQEWRDFLLGDMNSTFRSEKVAASREKLKKIFASCLDDLEISLSTFLPDPNAVVHSISNKDAQKILWELSELNFRFELVALDRRASEQKGIDKDRQEIIRMCFPGATPLIVADIANARKGLGSPYWRDRLPFLLRLRELMRDWSGTKPTPLLLPDLQALDIYHEDDVHRLEDAIARFYTQTFFRFFGRAAVIPMTLPPPT